MMIINNITKITPVLNSGINATAGGMGKTEFLVNNRPIRRAKTDEII